MSRSTLGRTLFSAAVALVLGLGVRDAVASPSEATRAHPYCRDGVHCLAICAAMYPNVDEPAGYCSPGHTCYCDF